MPRNQYSVWPKKPVEWMGPDNELQISVVFTWQFEHAVIRGLTHHEKTGGSVRIGGPAIALLEPKGETPTMKFGGKPRDAYRRVSPLDFMNPHAVFTTRGCPNSCSFCAVPKIEGEFRELSRFGIGNVICDNNLLAASDKHFSKVIRMLSRFDQCDFNQGLDARRFTTWHAGEIAKLKKPKVRFAFDHINSETAVMDAIATARAAGIPKRQMGVYVLVGFHDTPENALYRLEKIRSLGIRPNPMRYQPLDALKKNDFVGPGWTERQLRDVMRYYAGLRWFGNIPFEEYRNTTIRAK